MPVYCITNIYFLNILNLILFKTHKNHKSLEEKLIVNSVYRFLKKSGIFLGFECKFSDRLFLFTLHISDQFIKIVKYISHLYRHVYVRKKYKTYLKVCTFIFVLIYLIFKCCLHDLLFYI